MTTVILLTAMLTRGSESIEFSWTPKRGDSTVWSVSIKSKVGEQVVQADSAVTREVTKADKDEVVVRSVVRDALARTGADEGRLKRPEPTTFTMDARGMVVKVEGQQKDLAWRLAPFNHFVWPVGPVAPGSTWSANLVGDKIAGRSDYKLESVKEGVATVSFVGASLAGDLVTKGQGFWLLDLKSGRAVALHADIDGLMATRVAYDMKLVK